MGASCTHAITGMQSSCRVAAAHTTSMHIPDDSFGTLSFKEANK